MLSNLLQIIDSHPFHVSSFALSPLISNKDAQKSAKSLYDLIHYQPTYAVKDLSTKDKYLPKEYSNILLIQSISIYYELYSIPKEVHEIP